MGSVALVGAGPGDAGLITVKGLARLRQAEVVVYDALANRALVEEAPAAAERIDVGKRAGAHKLTQDQINEVLLDRARQGRFVVRLKGGDPYLFGRGAEEAAYLGRHGVACEVVSGVTSGIAAAAAAGIPVTHRGLASTVTFVTGHEDPSKADTSVDYAALAKLIAAGGTACFYMGVGRLSLIRDALAAGGLPESTPAALIQWGTLARQRSVRGGLGGIVAEVEKAGIGSPAMIVVGAVAGLEEPGLDFFTARPLFGRRVVVTRTRPQASALREKLEGLGAQVLEAPTIEVGPPAAAVQAQVDAALRGVSDYDWLIMTSANGVEAVAGRLFELGLDGRALAGVKVAAVGEATARALRERLGVVADLTPAGRFDGESLADELIGGGEADGRRMLLLRADLGRAALPKRLREAGAVVTDLAVYENRLAAGLPDEVVEALRRGEVDWATFTSASTARNLVELLGEERRLLEGVRIASIGPMTTAALVELGLRPQVEAAEASLDGLVAAVCGSGQDGGRDPGQDGRAI